MRTATSPCSPKTPSGSDSAQQLLALCHAAVSDPWCLEGRFRELIACATRHPEKPPGALARAAGLLLTGWPGALWPVQD